MYQITRILLAVICLTAISVASDFPHLVSYQGRVTDGANAPVTNPAANMQFHLYTVAAAGAPVWSEAAVVVVTDGLFNHVLGSSCPGCSIPTAVFQNNDTLWLEVQYEAEILTPRTMLVASPYAYRVATVDKSTGGTITGEVVITGNAIGNQLEVTNTGPGRGGFFSIANGGNTEPAIQGTHVGPGPGGSFFSDGGGPGIQASATFGTAAEFSGDLELGGDLFVLSGLDTVGEFLAAGNTLRNYGGDGLENWRLWGSSYGQLQLYDASVGNVKQAELSALVGGGTLTLNDPVGSNDKILNAGSSGDASVILGADAVNASEIRDEPGVANNKSDINLSLGLGGDIVLERTINCPTAGYVLAYGSGYVSSIHGSGTASNVFIWLTDAHFVHANKPKTYSWIPASSPTGSYVTSYSVQGVFSVPAGNTTFYLEALEQSGIIELGSSQLSLIFVPTSYGTVVSNMPSANLDDPALKSYPGLSEPETAERIAAQRLTQDVAKMQRQLDEMRTLLEPKLQENKSATID